MTPTDAIEYRAKAGAPFSALLFPGYFTLSVGVIANHPYATRICAYSIRSAGVGTVLGVPSYVIVIARPSLRYMEKRSYGTGIPCTIPLRRIGASCAGTRSSFSLLRYLPQGMPGQYIREVAGLVAC